MPTDRSNRTEHSATPSTSSAFFVFTALNAQLSGSILSRRYRNTDIRSTDSILPKNIWLEFMLGRHIHQESGIHYLLTFHALVISVFATSLAHASDFIPTEAQTRLLRGVASQKNGIRYVQGSKGHDPDDTHGPMTYYSVSFSGRNFFTGMEGRRGTDCCTRFRQQA
jgi:hypothetical protein